MRHDNDFDVNDLTHILYAINALPFYQYDVSFRLDFWKCRFVDFCRYTRRLINLGQLDFYYIIYNTTDIPMWQLFQFDSSNRG